MTVMPAMPHPASRRRHPYPPRGAGGPIGPLDRLLAAAGLGVNGATLSAMGGQPALGYERGSVTVLG
jgi:hypothetical protein